MLNMACDSSCVWRAVIVGIILFLNACPTLPKDVIFVRRNGRPIIAPSSNDNSNYNTFDVYEFVSTRIPSFGTDTFLNTTFAISEVCSTFKAMSILLMKTALQAVTKIVCWLSQILFTVHSQEVPLTMIIIIGLITLTLFLLYRYIMTQVRRQVNKHLLQFHDMILNKIESVEKDTEVLASVIKTNNEKVYQLIISQNVENEKNYFDDPMFILKGIADNIRTIVSHDVKCKVHKKRKAMKVCRPIRKAKCNKGKVLKYVENSLTNNMFTKNNNVLSRIEATYETEKVLSVKDKFSQIHRKCHRISFPTYCVSKVAFPQRVWIGGKWYLEDKNELRAAFTPKTQTNSSIPIKLQSTQNSFFSNQIKSYNNLKPVNNRKLTEQFKTTNEDCKVQTNPSPPFFCCHCNGQCKMMGTNVTYTFPSPVNRKESINPKTKSPTSQPNRNQKPPIASNSLNFLETKAPHRNCGGGDTYIREVWNDPKEEKIKIDMTYSREESRGNIPMSVRTHVSTQTEKKHFDYADAYAQYYYYPFVYTSTPKSVCSPQQRGRRPNSPDFYSQYYGCHLRHWRPNYYYGLQPVRL